MRSLDPFLSFSFSAAFPFTVALDLTIQVDRKRTKRTLRREYEFRTTIILLVCFSNGRFMNRPYKVHVSVGADI